jgi:hypothetical protein
MASATSCSLARGVDTRIVAYKNKVSPKKLLQRSDLAPKNNNSEQQDGQVPGSHLQLRRNSNARSERKRDLAALLLQRQAQVWLLRRQETMRLREVQRLREELRQAATSVISASYRRYVKRRAISRYLLEAGDFETRLDELLQSCVSRKRQMEEAQRFATLRKKQKQAAEDHKRKLVRDWLTLWTRTQRGKRERATARAHEQVLGWVRRWKLRKRCEARAIAREEELREEAHRHDSAATIVTFVRAYKLRLKAKKAAQKRRNTRDGLAKLGGVIAMIALRNAQSRWLVRTRSLAQADAAAVKLQRVCQGYRAASRYARIATSCLVLQRVLRGHLARGYCAKPRQCKLQEERNLQRQAAATTIQRIIRGRQTRLWFRDVLLKLRERFKCANCGVIEPGGTYCKYCGRHRTTFGALSTVLLLHEKWQLGRSSSLNSTPKGTALKEILSAEPTVVVPSPPKPPLSRSRSTSLASSSSGKIEILEPLTSLPVLLSTRHRRLVDRSKGGFGQTGNRPAPRRNSVSSVSEQTAQRAAALAALQIKCATSAQANVLEMHVSRLQRAAMAANRGTTNFQECS